MAKGKAKKSNDSLALPELRSLRSRKRECPNDEISESDGVQATLHHQDAKGNRTAVDAKSLQCSQSPLQESPVISHKRHQAADQSCSTEEEAIDFNKVMVKAFKGQEETTVANPYDGSQLEDCRVHLENDTNKSGKEMEEIPADECNRSQSCTDQLQVLLPTSEEGDGSCATALEQQLGKENSQSNLEEKQEDSHEECSNEYMADIKEDKKEPAAMLPARKKRRMGVCGLTEKERTHFLQTQKWENGQNAPARVEKQIFNNIADLVAQEQIISSPSLPPLLSISVSNVPEQNEEDIKLQSIQCGGDDRAETEVHVAVTASEWTSSVCDSGSSNEKSCEADGGIVPGLKETGDAKSDPTEQEMEGEVSGNQEQQGFKEPTTEITAENPQGETKDGGDGSAKQNQSPPISFYSEAVPQQENSVIRTRDEKKEELIGDAGEGGGADTGASSTDTQSGGFSDGSLEHCKIAVTPGGSERKDSCDPDDKPGPATLNTKHPQTRDTNDPFGSGYLDYVSDSQLNAIAQIEEEVMEGEEDLASPSCHDATDLVCGLIRELSSLNRKVMATHRELENLRRSSKSSSASMR